MNRKKIKRGYITIVIGFLLIILGLPFTLWFESEILGSEGYTLLYYLLFGGVGFFTLQSGITMLKIECQNCKTLNWFHAKVCKSCSLVLNK